jgi:hypothetical protein
MLKNCWVCNCWTENYLGQILPLLYYLSFIVGFAERGFLNIVSELGGLEFEPRPRIFCYT